VACVLVVGNSVNTVVLSVDDPSSEPPHAAITIPATSSDGTIRRIMLDIMVQFGPCVGDLVVRATRTPIRCDRAGSHRAR
jgi:hypothetical protein